MWQLEEILVRIARGGDGIGKRGELMLNNEAKKNAWLSVLVCHKNLTAIVEYCMLSIFHCRNVVVAKHVGNAVCVQITKKKKKMLFVFIKERIS